MQLMPATAAQHGVRNVFIPRENIDGGVRHLRMLLDRYGNNVTLAVAAYNAGTRRVEEAGGVPDIAETRDYVVRVLRLPRRPTCGRSAGVIARPVAEPVRSGVGVTAIPNLLSLLRIGLVPVLVVVLVLVGTLGARLDGGGVLPRRLHHRLPRRLARAPSRHHQRARTVPRSARRQAASSSRC